MCTDFMSLPDDLGKFDFITLHGVYSWVAPELRSCILGIIHQHLKPGGLVQVTYNAMPGWSSLLPVRELLRYFSDQASGDSIQRISSALNVLVDLKRLMYQFFMINLLQHNLLKSFKQPTHTTSRMSILMSTGLPLNSMKSSNTLAR